MNLQYGFIGTEDYKKAIDALESYNYGNKKIWVEQPHQGDYVKGWDYESYGDLLGEGGSDIFVSEITTLNEYREMIEEIGIDTDIDVESLFNDETIVYCFFNEQKDEYIFTDALYEVYDAIFDDLHDGRGVENYTIAEARDALENEISESLVIWLLR